MWFPVKTKDGKVGFISSAYIKKLDSSWKPPVDNAAPTVPSVNDKSTNVTGKSEVGSTLSVNAGTKGNGIAKASTAGTYTVSIPKQKAGTN